MTLLRVIPAKAGIRGLDSRFRRNDIKVQVEMIEIKNFNK